MGNHPNYQLAYVAARLGLGLHLVYSYGIQMYYWSQGGPGISFFGKVISGNSGGMPNLTFMYFWFVIAMVLLGGMLLLNFLVRPLAMFAAVVCIATNSALPAFIALGLVAFWPYNLAFLFPTEENPEPAEANPE